MRLAGKLFPLFSFLLPASKRSPIAKCYNLTSDGNQTAMPCGCCLCPKNELGDLSKFHSFRTVSRMNEILDQAEQLSKKAGEILASEYSLKTMRVQRTISPSFSLTFSLNCKKLMIEPPPKVWESLCSARS